MTSAPSCVTFASSGPSSRARTPTRQSGARSRTAWMHSRRTRSAPPRPAAGLKYRIRIHRSAAVRLDASGRRTSPGRLRPRLHVVPGVVLAVVGGVVIRVAYHVGVVEDRSEEVRAGALQLLRRRAHR